MHHKAHSVVHADARRVAAILVSLALWAAGPSGGLAAQDASRGASWDASQDASRGADPYAHLAVELSHPVYRVIEAAELRGAVTRLSAVKPYSRAQVAGFLASALRRKELFSRAELAMVRGFATEFSGANPDRAIWKMAGRKAAIGVDVEADGRLDAGGLAGLAAGTGSGALADMWHLHSLALPYLKGAPAPWLSMYGALGFTLDKVEESLFLPYGFTKEWDGWHMGFGEPRYSNGGLDYPMISFDLRADLAASTPSGSLNARFSRLRHDWGIGSGSLSLSGTARPFAAVEYGFRPSEMMAVSHIVGSLADWTNNSAESSLEKDGSGDYSAISRQRMLAVQRFEFFPFDWLTVGATSTMVGAKRMEIGYFSPLLLGVLYQNVNGNLDNMGVQVDAQVLLPRIGKLYGSFYADEMEVTDLSQLFTKARNMFALQGGLKADLGFLPFLPFAAFTAQYTKIEPFVYAHYPTWYPDYRLRVDTSWTNDGENIGYRLPPNSDEFLFGIDALPSAGLRMSGSYSFIRHGDNPSGSVGDALVFGDAGKWLEYATQLGLDKDFLHDGLYDFSHVVRFSVSWRPLLSDGSFAPFELGAGYGFAYTWWIANDSGEIAPAPTTKHILEFSAKLSL